MSETESFGEKPGGRFAVGCASLFVGIPAVGTAVGLYPNGVLFAAIPLVVGLVLIAIAYVVFNEDVRVTLDERGMRLSRARVLFGARMAERVDWDIPLAALTQAREVHTKTPASKGGWNHSTKLQLPNGKTLDATELGGAEESQSAYNRLVRVLRKRLGDAFERDERIR